MKSYDLMIKNGTVVTACDTYKADIGVKDGLIVEISSVIEGESKKVIDAEGKYVCPGAIDIHSHIDSMLHGTRTKDDWYDATVSAAFGGVTSVVDYCMQNPGQPIRQILDEWYERAQDKAIIDYSFSPVIADRNEEIYKEIPQIINDGFTNLKVFMTYNWRVDDYELLKILDTTAQNGGLLMVHAENDLAIDYLADKLLTEGRTAPKYHVVSRPPIAEEEATGRVINLAKMIDAPVFIVHMSCKGAVNQLVKAKASGQKVYGETCPHFLLLDKSKYDLPGFEPAKWVITPPLRETGDQEALWHALELGAISTVGSDHCAFPIEDKERIGGEKFTKIPHGTPGIETRVPLVFSEGVTKKRITVNKFVEIVSTNPAKVAGIYPRKGTLAINYDADIMIIDPDKKVKITNNILHSKTGFTPYEGWEVQGYPVYTISKGKIVVANDELFAVKGQGSLIKRDVFKPF